MVMNMKKKQKPESTELLHIELKPSIKKALRDEANEKGITMSGIVAVMLYERYNPKNLAPST